MKPSSVQKAFCMSTITSALDETSMSQDGCGMATFSFVRDRTLVLPVLVEMHHRQRGPAGGRGRWSAIALRR
jgi:hypothetical protein